MAKTNNKDLKDQTSDKNRKSGSAGNPRSKFKKQNRKNNFNKKKTFGGNFHKDENYEEDRLKPTGNSVEDYIPIPELLDSTASLPWSTVTGLTYTRSSNYITDDGTPDVNTENFTSPGICVARVVTGLGKTVLDVDAVNVAAHAIDIFVRSYNSGKTNYNSQDLMQFILAVDDAFCFINWLQRLISTCEKWNIQNRYTPEALIEMQGVDYEDLQANYKQLMADVNFYILQASVISVPDTMPIFTRHAALFKDYYIEGDSDKDQIYMFAPVAFHVLNVGTTPGSAVLERATITVNDGVVNAGNAIPLGSETNKRMKVSDLRRLAQTILKPLYTNEDFCTMSGDMRKAFGEDKMITLQPYKEGSVVEFVKNDEILLQIKNSNALSATCFQFYDGATYKTGATSDSTFGDIYQDPNTGDIVWQNQCNTTLMGGGEYYDLAFKNMMQLTLSGQPSKEMNMLLTRYKCFADVHASGGFTHTFVYGSIAIPVCYEFCLDMDPLAVYRTTSDRYDKDTMGAIYLGNVFKFITASTAFKYSPKLRECVLDTTNNDKIAVTATNWQIDNFTYIYPDDLDYMNSVAILGLLNVPHVNLVK